MKKDKCEGALGFEPRTYRSAVDCSTTELYPLSIVACLKCWVFISCHNIGILKWNPNFLAAHVLNKIEIWSPFSLQTSTWYSSDNIPMLLYISMSLQNKSTNTSSSAFWTVILSFAFSLYV